MTTNFNLVVEVMSGHNLRPKDGANSPSAFVELHFDGQTLRTSVKEKDLNPEWNESFCFKISDPFQLCNLSLEACVYNNIKGIHNRSFIGRVSLSGASFSPYSDEAVGSRYPLEKSNIFSRVKRELCLKVYIIDGSSIKSAPNPLFNDKPESRPTSVHEPNQHQQQQQYPSTTATEQPVEDATEMKAEPQPIGYYALKETSPLLGSRVIGADKRASRIYDLVEHMYFLFVRVVKARELPAMSISGNVKPYVEIKIRKYKRATKHSEKKQNPEWNAVFAFRKDKIQASLMEVMVKKTNLKKEDLVGIVRFDLSVVPTRVPPESPLAPQWYQLEDNKGEKTKGELMLTVWLGMQADEAFHEAYNSDEATSIGGSAVSPTYKRSKIYEAPRLWYVRVNVIQADDLMPTENSRLSEVYAKAQIGNQVLKTKTVQAQTMNSFWNEDLLFVAAEPLEDVLILSVENRAGPNKEEIIGKACISWNSVVKRVDHQRIHSRWYNLEKRVANQLNHSGRIHVRICLDGGYHVFEESAHYSTDLRPAAKELWKPSIGVLELGILGALGLHPMKTVDGKDTLDAYCVAKYGDKWVRTRTIINSMNPRYNEQYSWEVYDPTTVLTVGVFDNSQLWEEGTNDNRDKLIGKVRIRISALQSGHIYTHSYPLLVLRPAGVKKMGELHLAIRFSCTSFINRLCIYSRPMLPKMHYIQPLSLVQIDRLRFQAVNIVAARLSKAEPPLREEVVKYILDVDSHLWSMRRSKVNFFRLMGLISDLIRVCRWLGDVCKWENTVRTVLVHVLFVMLVCFPKPILPAIFLYMFMKVACNYWYRPLHPPHLDTRLSYVEAAHPDELDEEFDTFPTSRPLETLRYRYDRLRSVAGRIQTVLGDLTVLGERLQLLLRWRDPCATAIFVTFCLGAALVLYMMPFRLVIVVTGFYLMRHPRFRHGSPSMLLNFFRRLPARTDSLM